MTVHEAYDEYWRERASEARRDRSRQRAKAATELLRAAGLGDGRLCEVGCGPGWTLEVFRDEGYEAFGLDASGAAAESARGRALEVRVADLEGPGWEAEVAASGPIDIVVALEVLEHVLDPLRLLRRLRALVRPGGAIVLSLPNELPWPARLSVLFGRLPFGGHDDPHIRHFDRAGARRLFAAAGLEPLGERPISLVPPRWPLLGRLAAPLARAFPGAFAISTLYLFTGQGD